MKAFLGKLLEFLESKTGFLILGFVVTTAGGSFLNDKIQEKKAENDHAFEMYRIRLAEAKSLQQKVLESANARSFYLHQVLAMLANPKEYQNSAISKFWDEHVEPTKDEWNKDLYFLHAQARVLFSPELADTLLIYRENLPILHDPVLEKLDEETYQKTKPTSLHGAFVAAHATVYHLLRKCGEPATCERDKLLVLAEKQLDYLEVVQSCLAYRLSTELLQNPYGPQASRNVKVPEQCVDYARKS